MLITLVIEHENHITGPWRAGSPEFPDIKVELTDLQAGQHAVAKMEVMDELQHRIAQELERRLNAAPDEAARQAVMADLPIAVGKLQHPEGCPLCLMEAKAQMLGLHMRKRQAEFCEKKTPEAAQAYLNVSLLEWKTNQELLAETQKQQHLAGLHEPDCRCQQPVEPEERQIHLTGIRDD